MKFMFWVGGFWGNQSRAKTSIKVNWIKPPLNWHKLNSDCSSRGNPCLAGGGGLICDDKGLWVKGYARAVGFTTTVAAELWALRDGIRLCISLKLPAVVMELDEQLLVDLLTWEDFGGPN